VFYTEAADHYNRPVGSYTHGVTLPPKRAKELEDVVGTMVGLQYIRMEEVAALPRRAEPFRVAVYAPLAQAPAPPGVVLVRGRARQIMLVAEAARGAGLEGDGATLGRPACAMIPAALSRPDGVTIPGAKVGEVVKRLETVRHANRQLEQYHQGRLASL
jgi:uncharacterized protein (DUF169 family)